MAGKYERKSDTKSNLWKFLIIFVGIAFMLLISTATFYFTIDKLNSRNMMPDSLRRDYEMESSINVAKDDEAPSNSSVSPSPQKVASATNKTDILLYNNAYISVYYRRCEKGKFDDNIVFYVENNYEKSVALMLEAVALDGVNVNVGWNESVAAHSKGEIAFPAEDHLPTLTPKIITLSCDIFDYNNLDDITEFNVIDVDLTGKSTPKQQDPVASVSLTAGETVSVISDGLDVIADIVGDFHSLINDIQRDSNFDRSRAMNYEQQWKAWEEETNTLLTSLSNLQPEDKLADAWENLVLFIKDLNRISHNLSNWDTNNDNLYLADEMTQLVNGCLKTVQESDKYMPAIEAGIKEYSESQNTSNRGSTIISGGSTSSTDKKQSKETSSTSNYKSTTTSKSNNSTTTGKSSNSTTTSKVETNSNRHSDTEAWVCAKAIVKSNLKSPSTADFCSFADAKVKHLGNGEYMVTGWVDAMNSFGAEIRENFVVTYTATRDGYKNGLALFS